MNSTKIIAGVLTATWFVVLPMYLWMNVDNTPSDTRTFIMAVRSGDVGLVKEMLTKGVNVNTLDYNGDPALIIATRNHNIELVRLLLDAGADVLAKDAHGAFAWDYAVKRKKLEFLIPGDVFTLYGFNLKEILVLAGQKKIMEITGLSPDMSRNVVRLCEHYGLIVHDD